MFRLIAIDTEDALSGFRRVTDGGCPFWFQRIPFQVSEELQTKDAKKGHPPSVASLKPERASSVTPLKPERSSSVGSFSATKKDILHW
jgi:hypothetical protein